jgi:hypothetical protein
MLTWATHELGDTEHAWTLRQENLRRARALGSRPIEASILGGMASRAADDGRLEDAVSLAAESLRISLELGRDVGTPSDDRPLPVQLCRCAGALALAGKADTAARLLGCSEALHEELGVRPLPWLRKENEQTLRRIRNRLGESSLAQAWERGRKLSADAAVALALEELENILKSDPPPSTTTSE